MPLAGSLFVIHLDAVIFHINQRGVGIELEGQYSSVAEELHAGMLETVASVGEQFAFDCFQHLFYPFMGVDSLSHHSVELGKRFSAKKVGIT